MDDISLIALLLDYPTYVVGFCAVLRGPRLRAAATRAYDMVAMLPLPAAPVFLVWIIGSFSDATPVALGAGIPLRTTPAVVRQRLWASRTRTLRRQVDDRHGPATTARTRSYQPLFSPAIYLAQHRLRTRYHCTYYKLRHAQRHSARAVRTPHLTWRGDAARSRMPTGRTLNMNKPRLTPS